MAKVRYYNIAEVSQMLNLPKTTLRYYESTMNKLKIRKIRNRRYYSQANIEMLKMHIGVEINQIALFTPPANNNKDFLARIEKLENKFLNLQKRLQAA